MIINSVLVGSSGGDTVTAKIADSTTLVGTKVILNYGLKETNSVSGLEWTNSNTSYPACLLGDYVIGMASSSSSGYQTYSINDVTNTATAIGRFPISEASVSSAYATAFLYNNDSVKIRNSGPGAFYSYTDTINAMTFGGYGVSACIGAYEFRRDGNNNFYLTRVNQDGSSKSVTLSWLNTTNSVFATPDGLLDFTNNKLYTIGDNDELVTQDLVNSSCPSISYTTQTYQIANNLYVNGQFSSYWDSLSDYTFYKVVKNGALSYTVTQQTLPESVSSVTTNEVISIGNLSNNRFFINTSYFNNNGSTGNLYIISWDGDNLSSAVVEETIVSSDLSSVTNNNRQRMLLSYDGKYLLRYVATNNGFTPELYKRTELDGWVAAPWDGSNFKEESLTGFTSSEPEQDVSSGEWTVEVSTVLPPS